MAKRQKPEAQTRLSYERVIETDGIKVANVPAFLIPRIERTMRNNRYIGGAGKILRAELRPGERVLELGGGVGLRSTLAALAEGVEHVTCVEANPDLIPMIAETHRLNGIDGVDLRHGAVARAAGTVDFCLREDFRTSSTDPLAGPFLRKAEVPTFTLAALLAEVRPTFVVCDIAGAELDLLSDADLDLFGIRALMVATNPKTGGEEGQARVAGALAAKGFYRDPACDAGRGMRLFRRLEGKVAPPEGSDLPARATRSWPIENPKVLVATCMKDEGPFILEWMAWHRTIGVTDFVVFTNDCSDGTTDILDRLEEMGEVTHLPNPALATSSSYFLPAALNYLHHLRAIRDADFVIPMDVDEFLNIRTGEGRLSDLFAATGPFDALSMSELNHGSNGRVEYRRGWIKDQFPAHETETPGKSRAWHGVKTITRLSPRVKQIRNHRPHFLDEAKPVLWLDGSGRYRTSLQEDPSANGHDVRGTYDLVALEHYPLRSLNSYFMKMVRGDAVKADKMVSRRYWRYRNRHAEWTSSYAPGMKTAAREYHRARYETDAELMALHDAACDHHERRIAEILEWPEIRERRDWIMEEAWNQPPEPPAALAAE